MSIKLPNCGLYRTGRALLNAEEQVPEGVLVYFHNHSDQDSALVLTPHVNEHNRWRFHDRGWPVEDAEFISALVALKPEGLYVTAVHLHVTHEEIIPERTLVQLGYNRSGDSILFVGRFEENTITFPSQGYTSASLEARLEPVGFNVPRSKAPESLH